MAVELQQAQAVLAQCTMCRKICKNEHAYHIGDAWEHGPVCVDERADGLAPDIYMRRFSQAAQMYCPDCLRINELTTWQYIRRNQRLARDAMENAIDRPRDEAFDAKYGEGRSELRWQWIGYGDGCRELYDWLELMPDVVPGRVQATVQCIADEMANDPNNGYVMAAALASAAAALRWWGTAANCGDQPPFAETSRGRTHYSAEAAHYAWVHRDDDKPYVHPEYRPGTHKHDLYHTDKFDAWRSGTSA